MWALSWLVVASSLVLSVCPQPEAGSLDRQGLLCPQATEPDTTGPGQPARQRVCPTLFVGGSVIQPQASGQYVLQRETYNNRLVYRHICQQFVLHEDVTTKVGHTRWVLTQSLGAHPYLAVSRTSHAHSRSCPSQPSVTWCSLHQSAPGSSPRYVPDPRMTILCVETPESCEKFVVRGADVPYSLRGPYGLYLDGRQADTVTATTSNVYKHADNELYWSGAVTGDCVQWSLQNKTQSDAQPSEHFLMRTSQVTTSKQFPIGATQLWTVTHGASILETYGGVRVECVDEHAERMRDVCGRRQIEARATPLILGGRDSTPGKWPFMVSFRRADGIHKCGGTLLNERWFLTAGHCVHSENIQDESVLLGAYDLDVHEKEATKARIRAVHIHPQFIWTQKPFRLDYDVALVELDRPVTMTDRIQAACLPPVHVARPSPGNAVTWFKKVKDNWHNSCYIVGWGQKDILGDVGGTLQESRVLNITAISDCQQHYFTTVGDWMLHSRGVCVTGQHAGRMCRGDSGSPLFCQDDDGAWFVLALGGWSHADCTNHPTSYPSVYVDVSHFTDWIQAVIHGQ